MNSRFSPEQITLIATECGFIKRKRIINASNFLELLIFNHLFLSEQGLNDLAIQYSMKYGKSISKQSLNERFNESAIEFLKQVVASLLNQEIGVKNVFARELGSFKKVLIKDSTSFQVHPSLADIFPGSGGAGSDAAVRIQFEYDLLTGQVTDLSINPFKKNDLVNAAETVDCIEKDTLIIRDLGYITADVLQEIIRRNSFFLNRLHPTTKAFVKKGGKLQPVNFRKILSRMKQNGIQSMELMVFVTEKMQVPVRMIIHLLPDNIIRQRLKKAHFNAHKKKHQVSKEFKIRSNFNIYITNIDQSQLSLKDSWLLYKIRWQIELIFKTWKSVFNLSKVAKRVNIYRFMAFIYSNLLFFLTAWHVYWSFNLFTEYSFGKSLSYMKFFKTMKLCSESLRLAIRIGNTGLDNLLIQLIDVSLKNHIREPKKLIDKSNPYYRLKINVL